MAQIVLFHHAQGPTTGVAALADALRNAGHAATTPDLYGGRTFATLPEGLAFCQSIGFGALIERGSAAVAGMPADLVYIGLSLGVLPAQYLAQTRSGARGAFFVGSCIPLGEFGPAWPQGVPVAVHAMADDPIFVGEGDIAAARALTDAADNAELVLYPGDRHLFMDASLPDHDAATANLLTQNMLAFLDRI